MYLKTDRIVATFGDVVMRSYRLGTDREFILDPTAITGWEDSTAIRRDSTIRMGASGDFTEPYWNASRLITLSGTAIASDLYGLLQMRDQLMGAIPMGEYIELGVEAYGTKRYASVAVEGTTSWVRQSDTIAVWKIDLYSPDAYLYGELRRFSLGTNITTGGLKYPLKYRLNYGVSGMSVVRTFTNQGNSTAWPVFEVIGDYVSGFTLSDGQNRIVRYTGTVMKSSPLRIDMGRGTATQNGVDRTVLITERGWFGIPPGGEIQPAFKPIQNGSGWCDIIYRDTWI